MEERREYMEERKEYILHRNSQKISDFLRSLGVILIAQICRDKNDKIK